MICSMFGHHDAPDSVIHSLTDLIHQLVKEQHIEKFLVGNQGKFDAMAYQVLSESVIPKFPQIDCQVILAYLPSVRPLAPIYKNAKTIYPEGLEKVPLRFAISHRNRWMVDQSDIVLVYCRCSTGGTASIAEYAKKKGKILYNLSL
ncbi:MAG: hypothetical protein IKU40_01290 [Clostridia bacterium]|nr:hypothetical protein [Clostridia bacterium]